MTTTADLTDGRRRLIDVVTTPERRKLYEATGLWDGRTLVSSVCDWALRAPERLAVVDDVAAETYSYARLYEDALGFAGTLQTHGVAPGCVVSVQMPNWYETVAVDLGLLMAGAVLNPLLPIYREREVRNAFTAAGARHIVTPGVYRNVDYRRLVATAAEDIDGVEHLVVDRRSRDPFRSHPTFNLESYAASEVSELIFSSGTEATPKAIMHTEQTANAGIRMAASAIGLSEGDGVWMPSPIGHSTGLNFGVRMALYFGQTLTLQDVWDPAFAVELIARTRPAYTLAATTFLADLVDEGTRRGADLSCLRLFGSGGAPVPAALVERAAELKIGVLRLYGSTEVLVGSWNRPDSPWEKRVATDGVPFDAVELEVRDDDGNVVIGAPGELFVRSPSTAVGFFADPDRTKATFEPDGWVRSGDIGVVDGDGYFTMVGRRKEIIIRGGLNITPREIEDLLITIPAVREAAVVGLPHPRLGEIGCACLVLEPGMHVTLDDTRSFLRSRGLATFKLPERLVVLEQLPKTSTGKVQKSQLVSTIGKQGTLHQAGAATQ